VKIIFRRWFDKFKRRINKRLDKSHDTITFWPDFAASNIDYEVSDRVGAISCGGIGAIHMMAKRYGLIETIDQRLHLLKFHRLYQESDHVLNIAYNALCNGTCLQDIEVRRNDLSFLNALGATRIPDPTTSGDFCRRFTAAANYTLIDIFNETRLKVWAKQPHRFFDRATIDMDGTKAVTTGECKRGMDISYDGLWCYHPGVLTLAETGEVLSIVNRSGNRPSHEGIAQEVDRALLICVKAGFRQIVLRGDTDFSQTERLDGWNYNPKIRFYFGYDAKPNLEEIADKLPESAWRRLQRPVRHTVKTEPRRRPAKVKEQVVKARQFENQRLVSEDVAEFDYRPTACQTTYRMVVVRKNISVEKGEQVLFPNDRYFFYITNDREHSAADVVFQANGRCNQENLIAQLKSGVHALRAPVDNLLSNWAYMLMTALAWNLKAWFALTLSEKPGRWQQRHHEEKQWVLRLEFKTFLNAFMLLPCQIIKKSRKIVYRLLGWNPHLSIFFRLLGVLRQ
jgi:hypothetical protein